MSLSLFYLFFFMACTFALGLFIGWSFWRFGRESAGEIDMLKSQAEIWRKSYEQSRQELWNLQEDQGVLRDGRRTPTGILEG